MTACCLEISARVGGMSHPDLCLCNVTVTLHKSPHTGGPQPLLNLGQAHKIDGRLLSQRMCGMLDIELLQKACCFILFFTKQRDETRG